MLTTVLAQEDCYHGDVRVSGTWRCPSDLQRGSTSLVRAKGLFLNTDTGFKQGTLSIDFPDDDDTYEFDSTKAMDVDARILTNLYAHYEMIEMQWLVYRRRTKRSLPSSLNRFYLVQEE
jgi:hypothetical protein